MTDLALFNTAGVPAIADFKKGLQQARVVAPALTSGVQYMKMNQVGSPAVGLLTYGAEQTEVQEGSKWVVNTMAIEHGFILRDGGSVNGEAYGPITNPLPSDLRPAVGNEQWKQAYKCTMVCISGEDIGTVVEYAGDAGGVIKLFKTVLLPQIELQLDADPEHLFPALTFEVHHYHSKKQHKDIYEAHGTIVDWLSNEDVQAIAGTQEAPAAAAPAAAPEPAPATAPAEEPAASTEEAAPQRPAGQRRRRRSAAQ